MKLAEFHAGPRPVRGLAEKATVFENIVVPLDGSELAESALATAIDLCRRMNAKLELVRVHQPPDMPITHAYEWDCETRRREQEYLRDLVACLRARFALDADQSLIDGHVADGIVAAAASRSAALVVMTSHGRTGFNRVWIGSTADAVVRHASTPVLLVRAAKPATIGQLMPVNRVIVPLDGSPTSREVLPHASALATALGAVLELVRVVTPGDVPSAPSVLAEDAAGAVLAAVERKLEAIATQMFAGAPALSIRTRAVAGDSVADTLIHLAQPAAHTAVAMTTRSSGVARLVVGSVADKIIRAGPQFLLLLRPSR
jgi:nucleotide-binding universal stress UspA family protein